MTNFRVLALMVFAMGCGDVATNGSSEPYGSLEAAVTAGAGGANNGGPGCRANSGYGGYQGYNLVMEAEQWLVADASYATPTVRTGSQYSGGQAVWFPARNAGAYLLFGPLPCPAVGGTSRHLWLRAQTAPWDGQVKVSLGASSLGPWDDMGTYDFYATAAHLSTFDLGTHTFPVNSPYLRFEVVGKNAAAESYSFLIDDMLGN